MKLGQWAKGGLSYKGFWRTWKTGQVPVPAEQLPTGTIVIMPYAIDKGMLRLRLADAGAWLRMTE